MVPDDALLPDVLPTDRLGPTGRPVGRLRDRLHRPHDGRNVVNLVVTWLEPAAVLTVACWWTPELPSPLALLVWFVAILLMGRTFARLSILGHEAAHRLLFSNRRVNDFAGRWLLDYPAFVPFDAYRRAHLAHHRDELGPGEPDMNLYAGYPVGHASFLRKLRRDALGSSGWKNLRGLFVALRRRGSRGVALRIIAVQIVLFVLMGALSGRWWLWPMLWLLPWMTVWRVFNRLRAIAEHGGMERSADRRRTTHVVHQTVFARFWIVPFNTGWHLAHHADMAVPFQQLPALHRELVESGWVPAELESPTYTALWKALASG